MLAERFEGPTQPGPVKRKTDDIESAAVFQKRRLPRTPLVAACASAFTPVTASTTRTSNTSDIANNPLNKVSGPFRDGHPSSTFKTYLHLGPRATAQLAYSSNTNELVVIKQCSKKRLTHEQLLLIKDPHEHIIHIKAMLVHDDTLHVVQECMAASLMDIINFRQELEDCHIQTVCSSVSFPSNRIAERDRMLNRTMSKPAVSSD